MALIFFSQAMARPDSIQFSNLSTLCTRADTPAPIAQEAESAFPESILRPGFMATPALCSLEEEGSGKQGRAFAPWSWGSERADRQGQRGQLLIQPRV